ncbi:MAG TPA: ABC transporter ATP-binding protein [Eubacteriales bacterium]|nr:ABC transporter ATP-binding protein [Eubacteriales bacterium]
MPALVEIENVHFAYSDDGPEIISGLNLTIERGEYIALIGQNGSGKTTLSKLIGGLNTPTSGEIRIDDVSVATLSVPERTARVGYCYQNPDHQIFLNTVEEEVAFGPKNMGLSPGEIEERVVQALEAVGLLQYRKEEPYFSGKGERQKIAVASVLAMQPSLIVLDEPTTGLDWRDSQNMMRLIDDIRQTGHTIMIITHNMRLVAEYAERAVVMCHGEIKLDGTPAEVFQHEDTLKESFVSPPQITQLWRAVEAQGAPWLNARQAVPRVKELMQLKKNK